MDSSIKLICLLFITLFLYGCTFHPLGIPDDEWLLMTPEQQLQARVKQAEIDEAARLRRLEQIAEEEAAAQRLVQLRSNAPLGDVVQCTFRDAKAKFGKGDWLPVQPTSFAIHRSESDRSIHLPRQDRPSSSADVHVAFDGLNVKVCRWYDRDCATLAGTERAFKNGYSQHIKVNGLMEGLLYCSYPLSSQRRY